MQVLVVPETDTIASAFIHLIEKNRNTDMIFGPSPEKLAAEAKENPRARENLISKYEKTILQIASKSSYKFVTKEDDEWSVALYAFSKAIDSYEEDKGKFINYAAVIIKRDLVDYYRSESKHDPEISYAPESFTGQDEEANNQVEYAVVKSSIRASEPGAEEEIAELSEVLKTFGFRFMDLTKSSPHQDRSRSECMKAVDYLCRHEELVAEMTEKKQLPVSAVAAGSGVSRKTLDKYRKYIIASVIILSQDYPYLAQYIRPTERRLNS